MTGEGILEMSVRDLKRLRVVHEVIEKHVIQREAAEMIGRSERQVRRLVKRVREAVKQEDAGGGEGTGGEAL
jgi:transposase